MYRSNIGQPLSQRTMSVSPQHNMTVPLQLPLPEPDAQSDSQNHPLHLMNSTVELTS